MAYASFRTPPVTFFSALSSQLSALNPVYSIDCKITILTI